MKKSFLLAVAALTFFATPVMAKEGLYIGAYLLPSVKLSGVSHIGSGDGYGFRAGLGFNRYFALEGSYETTEQDQDIVIGGPKADLKGWAVDLKVNFPLTSLDGRNVMTLEPYIRLGYGIDYEVKIPNVGSPSGSGPRFGVGIELYLFRELSVSAGWTRTKVSFDAPLNNVDGRVKAIDVGLTYHFI